MVNLPSINLVTSQAPTAPTAPIQKPSHTSSLTLSPGLPSASGQCHSHTHLDPNFLSAPSPILIRHASPTSLAEDVPPSPTLSATSLFKTTTDLRGRNPGDGLSSLQTVQQRARKNLPPIPVPEVDHAGHPVPPSSATSFTAAASSTPPTKKDPVDRGDGNDVPPTFVHVNPGDDHTDPTPFAFEPFALAALVDPKTLKDLEKMGGLQGLCTGLGTSLTKGLSAHSLGQGAGTDGEQSGGEGPFAAPLSDRQRVYGINTLPTRRSKSLLQLMWLALKDEVLVC